MREIHIQHHNHNQNYNALISDLREELFGDIEFSEFCAYAFIACMFAVLASVGIYMAAFYLI